MIPTPEQRTETLLVRDLRAAVDGGGEPNDHSPVTHRITHDMTEEND